MTSYCSGPGEETEDVLNFVWSKLDFKALPRELLKEVIAAYVQSADVERWVPFATLLPRDALDSVVSVIKTNLVTSIVRDDEIEAFLASRIKPASEFTLSMNVEHVYLQARWTLDIDDIVVMLLRDGVPREGIVADVVKLIVCAM